MPPKKRSSIALTRAQLYARVWSRPISAVAGELGVSSNALVKICNRLLVPYPTRGYWAKKKSGAIMNKPPLPEAPEEPAKRVTISKDRAASRRSRTRLSPEARREHLIDVARTIIAKHGLHGASMKQIAAHAGISETLAYNYFRSREHLLVELARREFAHIRAARERDAAKASNHYDGIMRITRTYLREIGHRGTLLQTVLSSGEVRTMLRSESRVRHRTATREHAQELVDQYGVPYPVALGTTLANTAMSLRAGKLIADKKISIATAERLCLAMMMQSSFDMLTAHGNLKSGNR